MKKGDFGTYFGKLIKQKRKAKKITAEELAKKVGVDRTYISKIENHGHLPSIEISLRICSILGLLGRPAISQKESFSLYHELSESLSNIPIEGFKDYYLHKLIKNSVYKDERGQEIEDFLGKLIIDITTIEEHSVTQEDVKEILEKFAPEHKNNHELIKKLKTSLEKIIELEEITEKLSNKSCDIQKNLVKTILKPSKYLKKKKNT